MTKVPEKISYRRGSIRQGIINSNNMVLATVGSEVRIGSNVSNYKDRIAKRIDASSAYTRTWNEFSLPPFYSESLRKSDRAYQYGVDSVSQFSPVTSIVHDAATDDIALKRLKQRLSADSERFKALVPLGEINETRALIRSTADVTKGLLKGLLELKHGKPKGIVSAASKAWLQFSFAISPTIAEINTLANTINKVLLNDQVESQKYYGSATKNWLAGTNVVQEVSAASPLTWRNNAQYVTRKLSYKYTAGIKFYPLSSNNYGLTDSFGLSFGEIIPTFWELVPFSWVVDYFSTVGDFLSDTFETPAGSTIFCTRATQYRQESYNPFKLEFINPALANSYENRSAVLYNEQKHIVNIFDRKVYASLPHRGLRFKTVDEIGVNSTKRLLNLASLLVK